MNAVKYLELALKDGNEDAIALVCELLKSIKIVDLDEDTAPFLADLVREYSKS